MPDRQSNGPRIFLLAHGSFHGGWCWSRVAQWLREAGHVVHTPSFTGMGDRAHLMSASITIDTFVADLVGVIESYELNDVVLVGHSFAGLPVTGVADKVAHRLRHLVYLDAVMLESGKSAFSAYPPEEAAARTKAAERETAGLAVSVPEKLPDFWGLREGTLEYEEVKRRLTPHPLKTYTTALTLKGPIGNNVPRTFIECTRPRTAALSPSLKVLNAQTGWNRLELEAPHSAMITHPVELAKMLGHIAA